MMAGRERRRRNFRDYATQARSANAAVKKPYSFFCSRIFGSPPFLGVIGDFFLKLLVCHRIGGDAGLAREGVAEIAVSLRNVQYVIVWHLRNRSVIPKHDVKANGIRRRAITLVIAYVLMNV